MEEEDLLAVAITLGFDRSAKFCVAADVTLVDVLLSPAAEPVTACLGGSFATDSPFTAN